ncbi:hypothetical protein NFI96_008008 [Prochilodus magdalenae]|nr:hypothetical protein NFI96_008008 [Prochilodus magdalenae]
MAEASVAVDPDRFRCPVCLDLMKDPVAIPCGHSFCKVCIKGCWDLEDQSGVYSCPQCRGTFTQRPVPQRNSMLAGLMETLKWVEPVKKPELQAEFEIQKLDRAKGPGGSQRQGQLEEVRITFQQIIQDKERKLEEQKRAVNTLKCSAQAAVEDAERIFTELIHSIEKKRSEVTELIRVQESVELSRAEGLLEKLEQEIDDLRRRRRELDEVSHAEDDLQLLQSFRALGVTSASQDPGPSITVSQHLSSEDLRKYLSDLKERLEEFCEEEFSNIPSPGKRSFVPLGPRVRNTGSAWSTSQKHRLCLSTSQKHRLCLSTSQKHRLCLSTSQEHSLRLVHESETQPPLGPRVRNTGSACPRVRNTASTWSASQKYCLHLVHESGTQPPLSP